MKTIVKNQKEAKKVLFKNGLNIFFKKFNNRKIFIGDWVIEESSAQCGCGETFAYYAYNLETKEDIKIAICERCGE